jgi:hypothetical protein
MIGSFVLHDLRYLRKGLILIICGLFNLSVFAQTGKPINLDEISQKNVRKYIASRSIDQMDDFSSIQPSWKKETAESDFHVIEKEFFFRQKLSDIWSFYREASSYEMWNGRSVKFGLLLLKHQNSVIYSGNKSFPAIDTGQIYFLDVKLLKGILNVPLAFEITGIDQEHKIIELSYIDHNTSRGKQTLQFFDNGDGRTRIVHLSYFKSESAIRDDYLYPYFHEKFIMEFHRNMRKLYRNKLSKNSI